MNQIHPTAIVDPNCELGDGITIGPFAVIGPRVQIGDNCEIHNNVTLIGPTTISEKCRIFPFAVIGGDSQDKKYDRSDQNACLEIGSECIIREYCTINRGSSGDNPKTLLGNGCWILAYCHIAHDCQLGDNVVFANSCGLAGHVVVGKGAVFGSGVGVQQFVEIGSYCMLSARSAVRSNVPPYIIAQGTERARAAAINKVGLQRNNFSDAEIRDIDKVFRLFYKNKDLLKKDAILKIKEEYGSNPVISPFINFVEQHDSYVAS